MKCLMKSVLLVGALSGHALACDICSLYSAAEAQGESGKGPLAGVAEQFTHFGTVQVDGHEVSNPAGQYLDSSISQVFAGYNFNNRFGLQLNVPLIYRSYRRPDGAGGIEQGTEAGLGDIALLGRFTVYQELTEDFTFSASVLGGVKFPTGNTDRIKEEFNEVMNPVGPPSGIHGHDLTLGTGSYDGIVGASLYARHRRAFLSATVQYAIRSEGDFGYQFANDLTWNGGPGYFLVMDHRWTLALQAVVSGENKARDTFQGQSADDTGVTAVYLGPQLSFSHGSNLSGLIAVDLPLSIDNTALQTVPDFRVRAGVTLRF